MTSDDLTNMMAMFGAPQTAPTTPATFYEYETGLTVPAEPTPSPSPNYAAIATMALGASKALQDIGAGRAAGVEGKIANRLARLEAEREKMKGRRIASTAKAVAGAQGSGNAGDTLLSELQILQAAHTDARTKLYEGNISEYYAREKAKAAYLKAPADLLEGILEGSTLDKRRAGRSLLTGK